MLGFSARFNRLPVGFFLSFIFNWIHEFYIWCCNLLEVLTNLAVNGSQIQCLLCLWRDFIHNWGWFVTINYELNKKQPAGLCCTTASLRQEQHSWYLSIARYTNQRSRKILPSVMLSLFQNSRYDIQVMTYFYRVFCAPLTDQIKEWYTSFMVCIFSPAKYILINLI